MSKCRTSKCGAACCYNIALPQGFVKKHEDKIITKIIGIIPLSANPQQGFFEEQELCKTAEEPNKNKCPFLRSDYKCNVYDDRPRICRIYGEIPELTCKFRK